MQVRRRGSLAAGGVCAMVLGLGAVLVSAGPVPAGRPALAARSAAGPLLVRHAGTTPLTVDTARLAGPALRAWWADARSGATVDAGSVPRGRAVVLHPPDTGDGTARDWTLVVVDATRGLAPPA
jgi:Putative collagen-binding domain of a collagenase